MTYPCRYFKEVPTQPKVSQKKIKHYQLSTSLTWYKGGRDDGDSLSWFDFHHPALKYSAINMIWREALRNKSKIAKEGEECFLQLLSFLVEVAEGKDGKSFLTCWLILLEVWYVRHGARSQILSLKIKEALKIKTKCSSLNQSHGCRKVTCDCCAMQPCT